MFRHTLRSNVPLFQRTCTNDLRHSSRFFPPEASKEILEEFLPKMSTVGLMGLLRAQAYLTTFLPTDMESGMDPREWMPAMFRIWSMATRSGEFDRNFLSLFGRVARDNVAVKDMFTQAQTRTMFSTGLSVLNLPVGKGQRSKSVDPETGIHKLVGRNDVCITLKMPTRPPDRRNDCYAHCVSINRNPNTFSFIHLRESWLRLLFSSSTPSIPSRRARTQTHRL